MSLQPSVSLTTMATRVALALALPLALLPISAMAQSAGESSAGESSADPQPSLYWVFLVTGKPMAGVDQSEIETMQNAHLENFRKLAEDGRLVTAGPLSDPEGKLRGIVILSARNQNEVAEMFTHDPYIQGGYMEVVATPMEFEIGKIRTRVTPKGMEEFRMAVFEASPDQVGLTPAMAEQTRVLLKRLYQKGNLLLSIRLNDRIHLFRQIVIFPASVPDDELSARLAELPALKSGAWTHRLMPLYMGKGSLDQDE